MLSILNLSSTLRGTQEEVCSPLKFNRGHLGTIPFLKPCPVWQCKSMRVITVTLFNCFYSCVPTVLWKVHGPDGGKNTRLQHMTVLVNSEILAKVSFLKNHVDWFIVPGCVKLNGMLSCQEADNHSSEKPRSCFHITPAFSLGKKKKKSPHEFDPNNNLTSQAIDIWFGASFKKRTAINLYIKIPFHRWVITKDISERTPKTHRQLFSKKKIGAIVFYERRK